MNKDWSILNKKMQKTLAKKDTFLEGLSYLFILRDSLWRVLRDLKDKLNRDEFDAMPFINKKGYENKNIAYSIFHIFRIEDIVLNRLILKEDELFPIFKEKMHSFICTTGNELEGIAIKEFTSKLDIDVLYEYAFKVKEKTEKTLKGLSFIDLKRKFSIEDENRLSLSGSISDSSKANFLIPYWCNKDIKGLICMSFSRHWIMHIEASLRIRDKLIKR